jgi:hypothetical protein
MAGMRDYLLWLKQNQENTPAWRDAKHWQNRNQTPIKKEEPKPESGLPEGDQEIEETPEE